MTSNLVVADLCGRADGNVDHHMGRASGNFLRQHGRNELAFRIDVELTLDTQEDIVGGTEMHRAAPGDAATFGLHHTPQRRNVEVDRSERLHRIGRACRRGYRA